MIKNYPLLVVAELARFQATKTSTFDFTAVAWGQMLQNQLSVRELQVSLLTRTSKGLFLIACFPNVFLYFYKRFQDRMDC